MNETTSSYNSDFVKSKVKFFGKGSEYLGIVLINLLLTIITLGIYHPWGKEKIRKYIWGETELDGSRFVFHGTGKEMLRGFLIAYFIFLLFFFGPRFLFTNPKLIVGFVIGFYLLLIFLIPFAMFASWRYRMSRTSWRGIFFSFRGNLGEFYKLYFKNIFFVIITFGIYAAWMRVKLQKYLFSHTKLGDVEFDFKGDGGKLFGINLLFGLLLYITLFLYTPAYLKNRFNFTVDNTLIQQGEQRFSLKSILNNKTAYKVYLTNLLFLIISLGFYFPWAKISIRRMQANNILMPSAIDFDKIEQDADNYKDAAGDEILDILDMDFDF